MSKHKKLILGILAGWILAGFVGPPQQVIGKLRGRGQGGS
jgi:hypothetical protein